MSSCEPIENELEVEGTDGDEGGEGVSTGKN